MLHVPRCYLLGKLDRMYYGNNKTTARNIGFDDSFIYDEIALKLANRKLPPEILLHNEEIKVFEAWTQKGRKNRLLSFHNGLQLFHIVEIEYRDGIHCIMSIIFF